MLWMMMMGAALAGVCPWTETPRVVDASWKTIAVDGTPYPASTFGVVLFDCGEPEAAMKLDKWQSMRLWTPAPRAASCGPRGWPRRSPGSSACRRVKTWRISSWMVG